MVIKRGCNLAPDELEAAIVTIEEKRQALQNASQQAIVGIFKTLHELMNPPEPKKRSIGFIELEEKKT